jgi:hypothetical protein
LNNRRSTGPAESHAFISSWSIQPEPLMHPDTSLDAHAG